MKLVARLVFSLNVAAASHLIEIASRSKVARRIQGEDLNSNDKIDYLSFQKYNCEGMFLDWSGPSAFTSTLSSKIVEYDYDVYLDVDSDRNLALASIQNRLLRYVGEEVFGHCSDMMVIQEINTAPGDQPSSTSKSSRNAAMSTRF